MKSVLRDQLMGTWKLVSYVETPVDGAPTRFPFGDKPVGILMYTPDGFVSAQLMRPDRQIASGPMEYADAGIGYLAYSGPFQLDEATATLTHSMRVSLFPGWVGQTQARLLKLDGDRLELTTVVPSVSHGVRVLSRLMWERESSNA